MEKTTDLTPRKKGWRWGTNRWIVLGLLILGFIGAKYFFSPVATVIPKDDWYMVVIIFHETR